MLVLRRKKDEAIQIGDQVEVKILSIEGDQIKLGITAPQSIDIYRKELYLEIKEQNSAAAQLTADLLKMLNEAEKND